MALLNPHTAYAIVRRNGRPAGIHLAAPRQHGFLAISSVRERLDELDAFLTQQGTASAELLEQMGSQQITLEQNSVSTFPSYRVNPNFPSFRLARNFVDELLRTSTEVVLCAGGLPGRLGECLPGAYRNLCFCSPNEQVLWTKDAVTLVWWPYALSEVWASEFTAQRAFQGEIATDKTRFSTLGTTPPPALLEGLIPPFQRRALTAYFQHLRLGGCMRLGDRDSKHRAWMHNEKIARFLGLQFGEFISARLGIEVAPLFSHFVSYLEGASLPKHFDKDPNAFSLSIQLGYYKGGRMSANEWPFNVKKMGDSYFTAFTPQCGDGVLFHGESQEHYRDPISPNCVSDVLLLHFTRLA